MTFEKQNNPLEAQKQREGTPKKEEVQAKIDTLQQKESTSPDEVRTIAVDIAQMGLPANQIDAMLQRLPLAVRFQIQEQIIAEQRSMLTTMDPMKYQQYLQSVFPQGVPANIGEMYQGMAQGTAEMYKGVLAGIETTKAPETVQNTLQIDKSKATGAALKAKELTELLTGDLASIPQKVKNTPSIYDHRLS